MLPARVTWALPEHQVNRICRHNSESVLNHTQHSHRLFHNIPIRRPLLLPFCLAFFPFFLHLFPLAACSSNDDLTERSHLRHRGVPILIRQTRLLLDLFGVERAEETDLEWNVGKSEG
jgi:hypothetical protein